METYDLKKNKAQLYKKFVPIIITIIFLWYLLSQIDIPVIVKTFKEVPNHYVVVGFCLYIFVYCLRAIRFKILLKDKISFRALFSIVCVHTFINNVVPARAGEVSYIYMVKEHNKNINIGETVASLLLVRFCDIIGLSIIFLTSVLFVPLSSPLLNKLKFIVLLIIIIAIILLISIVFYGNVFIDTIEQIAEFLNIKENKILKYLIIKLKEIIESFQIIKNKNVAIYTLTISIIASFSMFLIGYFLFYGLGIHISMLEIFVAGTVGFFATILPIQGFLNFGTMEAGFVIGFSIFGISRDTSIAAGFSYHIILTVYLLILGCVGYYLYQNGKEGKHAI